MKQFVLGSVLAAVALFMFGWLYWGLSPAMTMGTDRVADDAATQELLRPAFTESGSYVVPHPALMKEDKGLFEKCHRAGPIAIIHIKAQGFEPMDPGVMMRGVLHSFASAFGLAFLMKLCLASLPRYGCRLGFAALVGALGSLVWDGGGHVWWFHSGGWTLAMVGYHLLGFVIMGAVLAAFIKPPVEAD